MTMHDERDADFFRSLLDYDPSSGVFTHKMSRTGGVTAGKPAGYKAKNGYVKLHVLGRMYTAHRVAWLMTYGVWPSKLVDHKNGDPSDNRIDNLREATATQNCANSRGKRGTRSGVKGVSWSHRAGRWRAILGKKHLGLFDDKEAANAAYAEAARHAFGEFARTR